MITNNERKLVKWMVKLKLWQVVINFRLPDVYPRCRGTRWIFKWLLRRQVVDSLHHAPCCPANHFHKQRLVFGYCTCGAAEHVRRDQAQRAAQLADVLFNKESRKAG